MNKISFGGVLFTLIFAPLLAFAACATPVGEAGAMFYNTTVNTLQFCDGSDWYNTGLKDPSATGTSCTNPTGPEGSAFYNTSQNTIQFCNGDGWMNMGTMRFPSATGTSCTAPAGPEGSMFFNTTVGKMQFCNGDDWVNATYLTVAADAITGVEMAKIQASDPDSNDQFGYSVSINDDYAIVGVFKEDTEGTNAGAAYIYKRTGLSWVQEKKLVAIDAQADDWFGNSVSINGDYAIVGANGEDSQGSKAGAAYIFKRTGSDWVQEQKLVAIGAQVDDQFGASVAIDADYVAIGAHGVDTGGSNSGAAYIFKRSGVNWTQEDKVIAGDSAVNDYLGNSISINGDYMIVGASNKNTSTGAAYIFKRTGTNWVQEAKLTAGNPEFSANFGSVAISGDYAIVGASHEDGNAANTGAAYIFKRTGTVWTQEQKFIIADGSENDRFGKGVALSEDYVVISSYRENSGAGSVAGAVYVYKRMGTAWTQETKLIASDSSSGDNFGLSVDISNGKVIVGAYGVDTGGADAGAAYIFD